VALSTARRSAAAAFALHLLLALFLLRDAARPDHVLISGESLRNSLPWSAVLPDEPPANRFLGDQPRIFYPYLLGYIAFFSKDYKGAVDELLKGDQQDPFVIGLIAQSYQRLGDKTRAEEYFRKVLAIPVHSINSAFARPPARAFLR